MNVNATKNEDAFNHKVNPKMKKPSKKYLKDEDYLQNLYEPKN